MRVIIFTISLMLVAVTLVSSCGSDGDSGAPGIKFVSGSGFITDNVTVNAGEPLSFSIIATSDVNSAAKLINIKVVRTFNNIDLVVIDSTISTSTFSMIVNANAYPNAGTERWKFMVTDESGKSASIFSEITSTEGNPIAIYSQKILGSYDNPLYGSSFASSTGVIFLLNDAKVNSSKIDLMYFFTPTAKATLAAPADATVAAAFSSGNGPASWTVRNSTKLKKLDLPANIKWDAITSDGILKTLATSATATKVEMLVTGDYVAFKTAAGKLGLIRITNLTTSAAGALTFDAKVQQ